MNLRLRRSLFLLPVLVLGLVLVSASGATFGPSFYASPSTQDAVYPDADVDNSGNAVFVWRTDPPSSCDCAAIDLRTRTAAGALGPVQQISAPGETGIRYSYPKVGVDADGDAVAVWTSSSGIRARARSKTGAFGPILTISPTFPDGSQVNLKMSKAGHAVFMWQAPDQNNATRIYARVRNPNGVLGPILTLSNPNSFITETYNASGKLAVDSLGDAVFVWKRQSTGGHTLVEARMRSAGGTLSAVKVVASAIGDNNHPYQVADPEVAVDADGDALVVWDQVFKVSAPADCIHSTSSNPYCSEIVARPLSKSGVLGAAGLVTTPHVDHWDANVALDADGDAYIVWLLGEKYKEKVQGRGRSRAGALSSLQWLSNAIRAGGPMVESDPLGNSMVAWHWSGLSLAVAGSQGRSRTAAGALSPIKTFGIGGRVASVSNVAIAANGKALVAWFQTDGVSGNCGESWGCWRVGGAVGP
jgi:hypothetical protein